MKHLDAVQFESLATEAGKLGIDLSGNWVWVRGAEQSLCLCRRDEVLAEYPVSTAERGFGMREGSYQTPMGWHRVDEKIGEGEPLGRLFKARQPQTDIAQISHSAEVTGLDCITSRILWLAGQEEGVNRGGQVDSHDRYIYIHGTHEEGRIGQPVSIGCVRMKNVDVVALFDCVNSGTPVFIQGE